MPRTVTTQCLPAFLREAGYRTIHVGKAHFGAEGTPGEEKNLAGAYPELRRELSQLLTQHLSEMDAQMPTLKATGEPVPYPDGELPAS